MVKKTAGNTIQTRSQKAKTRKPQTEMEPYILVKTKIWAKDSHGLFDYEAAEQQYINETQKIHPFKKKIQKCQKAKTCLESQARIYISRTKDCQTSVMNSSNESPAQKKIADRIGICQIAATRNKRGVVQMKLRTSLKLQNLSKINSLNEKSLQEQELEILKNKQIMSIKSQETDAEIKVFNPLICPFTVTKKFFRGASDVQGYPLRSGNIIKFGRVQYVVVQVKTDKQFSSLRNSSDLKQVSGYQSIYQVQQKQDEENSKSQTYVPTCKICLCHQQIQDDILISPCNCKGYCGLIHINCLKQWINSKVKKQYQGMVASYNFNKFQCQICKTPFPHVIKINDKRIEMMGIQKPDKSYIIIESINPPKSIINNSTHLQNRDQQRCLHVISSGQKNSMKIGRGHSCQIRLTDISVSRSHAQIQLNNNKFLIKDTKSKFGTLILFDEQFILNQKHPIILQSGRCLYQISIGKEMVQEENQGATESEGQMDNQNQNSSRNN